MTLLAGFASGFWSLLLLVSIGICAPQTMYGPSAKADAHFSKIKEPWHVLGYTPIILE